MGTSVKKLKMLLAFVALMTFATSGSMILYFVPPRYVVYTPDLVKAERVGKSLLHQCYRMSYRTILSSLQLNCYVGIWLYSKCFLDRQTVSSKLLGNRELVPFGSSCISLLSVFIRCLGCFVVFCLLPSMAWLVGSMTYCVLSTCACTDP